MINKHHTTIWSRRGNNPCFFPFVSDCFFSPREESCFESTRDLPLAQGKEERKRSHLSCPFLLSVLPSAETRSSGPGGKISTSTPAQLSISIPRVRKQPTPPLFYLFRAGGIESTTWNEDFFIIKNKAQSCNSQARKLGKYLLDKQLSLLPRV